MKQIFFFGGVVDFGPGKMSNPDDYFGPLRAEPNTYLKELVLLSIIGP